MNCLIQLLLASITVLLANTTFAELYEIPYMPRGDDLEHQGFIRITNLSTSAAVIAVAGIGDDGFISSTATFTLEAGATRGYRITELENGAPEKGLTGAIGTGTGDWQILFESTALLRLNGFYRNPQTGFLNSLHDTATPLENGTNHILTTVNPGSNPNQVGKIRLINATGTPTTALIFGTDDQGIEYPATVFVEVDLVPFGAVTLSMAELEQGTNPAVRNSLGDGSGKWRLNITSGTEIGVMSLIFAPDGYLSNISSTNQYRAGSNGSGSGSLTCNDIEGAIILGDSDEPEYLGFFGNEFASDSVSNTFGSFGSEFSSTSVFNSFSNWGSDFSSESAMNSSASRPPVISVNGQFVAFLTTNSFKTPQADPNVVKAVCNFTSGSRSQIHP